MESEQKSGEWRGWWRRAAERRLPALVWARSYSRGAAVGDLVAGVTLGLTLVPQSIAYAALADLPVQYGLYSAFVGTMLYVLFGTVKEVSIGPTSLTSLLTLQACKGLPIEYVVLLTFLSGCIVFVMGLLQLGFLVELISPAVTSGFTSGTALIIIAAQVKGLLGLRFMAESLVENALEVARRWRDVRPADCVLSAVCCVTLLLLRSLKDVRVSERRAWMGKVLWFVSISRNALVVCAASLFAYFTYDPARPLVLLSGRVEPGLPRLSLPAFSVTRHNETTSFAGMVQELGSALAVMPIVMVLANIAIAKAFSGSARLDVSQEMLTLGLCNICGAFVHAMPTCGAFTRSAVSHASGVRSPAAGLYSGIITLLALRFMTEYFYFIPKACLSSVLVCAVVFMIDFGTVKKLWSASRNEVWVVALTLCVTVTLSVELGVLAGALAALAMLLVELARPTLTHYPLKESSGSGDSSGGSAVCVRLPAVLVYMSGARVCRRLQRLARGHSELLLDAGALQVLDYTAAQELEKLIKKLSAAGCGVVVFNAPGGLCARLAGLAGVCAAPLRARQPHLALAAARKDPPGQPHAHTPLLAPHKADEYV